MVKEALRFISSPHTFEVLALFLASIGVALALSPDKEDIAKAHWFFGIAFLLATGRVAHLLLTWNYPNTSVRYLASFMLFGAIGIGWVATYDWVQRKIDKFPSDLASNYPSPRLAGPTASEIADELEKRLAKHPQAEKSAPTVIAAPIKQPFSIEVENSALMSNSRDWQTGFWVQYQSEHGQTITPVHLALFLRFVNLQSVDTHIDSYTVEINSGERWIPLIRLPTEGTTIWNAYPTTQHPTVDSALSVARRYDFSESGLENQLSQVNGLLKPEGMVRGWALYEYPKTLQRVTGQELIRVTVKDVNGATAIHVHSREEETIGRNRALGQWLKVAPGEPVDISALFRKHWASD